MLGMLSMVFGFLYWLRGAAAGQSDTISWFAFWFFALGGVGLVMTYLAAGSASVPRRFAVHLPEWVPYHSVAAVCAVIVILSVTTFVGRFLGRLRSSAGVS
jgi:cytochrome c oxidase subunit 1